MRIYKPIKQTFITQGFGLLNTVPELIPMYQELGLIGHNGLDFSAPINTPIYYNASVKGTVWKMGIYNDGCKYLNILVSDCGNNKMYQFRYLHLLDWNVQPGQVLEGGELIAYADNTGKYSKGSHLHFDLSPMVANGNSFDYAEPGNGYGGQIDVSPFYDNRFIKDVMIQQLGQAISLIQKILNFLKGRS